MKQSSSFRLFRYIKADGDLCTAKSKCQLVFEAPSVPVYSITRKNLPTIFAYKSRY